MRLAVPTQAKALADTANAFASEPEYLANVRIVEPLSVELSNLMRVYTPCAIGNVVTSTPLIYYVFTQMKAVGDQLDQRASLIFF